MRYRSIAVASVVLAVITLMCGCKRPDAEETEEVTKESPKLNENIIIVEKTELARIVVLETDCFSEPSIDSPLVPALPKLYFNSEVEILDYEGDWFKVRHASGYIGWVLSRDSTKTNVLPVDEYHKEFKNGEVMLSFEDFLLGCIEDINKWAPDAKIGLIYGGCANADGYAEEWYCIFTADSKPNEKMLVYKKDSTGYQTEICNIDSGFFIEMQSAPNPGFSYHEMYTGSADILSPTMLCSPSNKKAFFSSEPILKNKVRIESEGIGRGLNLSLVLTGKYWTMELSQLHPDTGIIGRFDPVTGEYLDTVGEFKPGIWWWREPIIERMRNIRETGKD